MNVFSVGTVPQPLPRGKNFFKFFLQIESRMKNKRNVTILDIAKELGLSKSTVSRALTGSNNINQATKDLVIAAARRLEYQPNLLAQSLSSRETHTVGVVIPDIEKPFFASIVSGIQHHASETGYRIMITQSNEAPATEIANIQALLASRVDGLLICHTKASENFDYARLLYRKAIPLVFFARVCESIPVPKVVEEDFNGAQTVVNFLIRKGRRRIAIIAGPKNLLASSLRVDGYMSALRSNGIDIDDQLISYTNFIREDVIKTLDIWMNLDKPVDGIFSIYDAGAIEAMKYLKGKNIRIPQDISVAGFGNDPAASIIEPGLTTFKQSPFEIGKQAFKLFLDQHLYNYDQAIDQTIIVKGELVVRESA